MKSIKLLLSIFAITISNSLFAQFEMLDSTFSNDGMLTFDITTNTENIGAIAIQSDGKIVVAGSAKIAGASQFAVARYNPNGSLDLTFATVGFITTAVGAFDGASAVAIQPDGKIVLGGFSFGNTLDFAVVRFNSDGTLDLNFDSDGKATAPVGTGNDVARTMILQADGKIVLGGKVDVGSGTQFGLARFNSDGSIDNSYGTLGAVFTTFGTNANDLSDCMSLGLQADGKIVATGDYSPFGGPIDGIPLARYNTDGSLDATFGVNGKIITHIDSSFSIGKSLVLQPDGKILVTSEGSYISQDYDLIVLRYNDDGSPDISFGNNGVVIKDLYGNDDRAASINIQADGKIITGGYTWIGTSFPDFFVARFNTDGSSDNSFGTNGHVWTEFGIGTNTIGGIIAQSDGKIIAAGTKNAGTDSAEFAIARYIPNFVVGIINFAENKNNLLAYPNPIDNNTTIKYSLTRDENISIRLIDVEGKIIQTISNNTYQKAGDYIQRVALPENLTSGVYFIQLTNENGSMRIKIVK